MFNKYEKLNDEARDYLILYLDKEIKDKKIYQRCRNEIELLYDKGLLFIIDLLHKYIKTTEYTDIFFRGMANNLLLLYVLGLNKVDPIKYNLPYELFTDKSLSIDFLNFNSWDFVEFMEKSSNGLRIVKGSYEETDDKELNEFKEDHYIIFPTAAGSLPSNMTLRLNEYNQFETIEDYSMFQSNYIVVRLSDKPIIQAEEVDLHYALQTDFEKELERILNPRNIEDYVKVISLGHSTHAWKYNQDKLFKENKIDKKNIISNREDIYEYLINHLIDKETSIDIVKQLTKTRKHEWNKLWHKYINIMKEHNCDDIFIGILSKIIYISGRGQAISECLYALDANNYVDM